MNDKLMEGINENHRLFLEPSSYKTLSVMVDNGFRAIMGSDIENWEGYFKCELPELKLEIDSFEKFILLLYFLVFNFFVCTFEFLRYLSSSMSVEIF